MRRNTLKSAFSFLDKENRPIAFAPGDYYKIYPDVQWRHIKRPRQSLAYLEEMIHEFKAPQTEICLASIKLRDLSSFAEQDLLTPLDDALDAKTLKHYFPPVLDFCKKKGKLYGIPEDFTPYVIKYPRDKDLRVPKTWEQLEKYSMEFSKRHGRPAMGVEGHTSASILAFIVALFGSNGFRMGDLAGIADHKKVCFEAYRWIQKLAVGHACMDLRWLDLRFREVLNRESSWAYQFGWLNSKKPLSRHSQFWMDHDFSLFPSGPLNHTPTVLVSGQAWVIPANTKYPKEGIQTLLKVTSLKNIIKLERSNGSLFHARQDVWSDRSILKEFPIYKTASRLPRNGKYFLLTLDENSKYFARSFFKSLVANERPKKWFSRLPRNIYKHGHYTVEQATSYLEKNLGGARVIEEVCARLQISRGHLDRLFQNEIMLSTADYLKSIRMERARKLLQESALSVKEVASQTGFSNRSVFSRAFHQHWGQSPTNIREKAQY
jgi:AraC-like DNA-binding protein